MPTAQFTFPLSTFCNLYFTQKNGFEFSISLPTFYAEYDSVNNLYIPVEEFIKYPLIYLPQYKGEKEREVK